MILRHLVGSLPKNSAALYYTTQAPTSQKLKPHIQSHMRCLMLNAQMCILVKVTASLIHPYCSNASLTNLSCEDACHQYANTLVSNNMEIENNLALSLWFFKELYSEPNCRESKHSAAYTVHHYFEQLACNVHLQIQLAKCQHRFATNTTEQ